MPVEVAPTLTSVVVFDCRSRTKISGIPLASPGTRSLGGAGKRHVTPIRRHGRIARLTAAAPPARVDAHQRRRAVDQVADKDVLGIVCIVGDQVAGGALKKRKLTIGGNTKRHGIPITATGAREIDADQRRGVAGAVAEKNIQRRQGCRRHRNAIGQQRKIVCRAGEKDVTPIGADDGHLGRTAATGNGRQGAIALRNQLNKRGGRRNCD